MSFPFDYQHLVILNELQVNGTTTFNGSVTFAGGVTYSGATVFNSTVTVNGTFSTTAATNLGNDAADITTITGILKLGALPVPVKDPTDTDIMSFTATGFRIYDGVRLEFGTDADTTFTFDAAKDIVLIEGDGLTFADNIPAKFGTDEDSSVAFVPANVAVPADNVDRVEISGNIFRLLNGAHLPNDIPLRFGNLGQVDVGAYPVQIDYDSVTAKLAITLGTGVTSDFVLSSSANTSTALQSFDGGIKLGDADKIQWGTATGIAVDDSDLSEEYDSTFDGIILDRDDTTTIKQKYRNNMLTATNVIYQQVWEALDAASAVEEYAKMEVVIDDPTALNPDGRVDWYVNVAGTLTKAIEMGASGSVPKVYFGTSSSLVSEVVFGLGKADIRGGAIRAGGAQIYNQYPIDSKGFALSVFEDFPGTSAPDGLQQETSGTSSTVAFSEVDGGQALLTSGDATSANYSLFRYDMEGDCKSADGFIFETIVRKVEAHANSQHRVGFHAVAVTAATLFTSDASFIGFQLNGAGNWEASNGEAIGAGTDTGVATAANQLLRVQVEVNGANNDLVFYINNVAKRTIASVNISNLSVSPLVGTRKTTSANAVAEFDVDYVYAHYSRRSSSSSSGGGGRVEGESS